MAVHLPNTTLIITQEDTETSKLPWKLPCRVATGGNIILEGLQIIDTIQTLVGDRILVRLQTDARQNGLYVAGSGAWIRTTDADSSEKIENAMTFITEGDEFGQLLFGSTTANPSLGDDEIYFAVYTGGTGVLSLNGLVTNPQFLEVGIDGNDFNIVSNTEGGAKHTFNIPDAAETKRGVITTGAQDFKGKKGIKIEDTSSNVATALILRHTTTTTPTAGIGTKLAFNTNTPTSVDSQAGSIFVQVDDVDLSTKRSHFTFNVQSAGNVVDRLTIDQNGLTSYSLSLPESDTIATPPEGYRTIFISSAGELKMKTSDGSSVGVGVGISSLGGLTIGAQTFGISDVGPIGWYTSGNQHRLRLPNASETLRGMVSVGAQTFTGEKTITVENTTAAAPYTILDLAHNTSDVPANGIGTQMRFLGHTSTTKNEPICISGANLTNVTHTLRTSEYKIQTLSSGTMVDSLVASGSGVKVGGLNLTTQSSVPTPADGSTIYVNSADNTLKIKDSAGQITGLSGITSFNSQVDETQTFATGTSGTSFNISSSGGVHTFNIPYAGTGITAGLLSAAAQTIIGSKTFTLPITTKNLILQKTGVISTPSEGYMALFVNASNKLQLKDSAENVLYTDGVASLGGQTEREQTFATGTEGANFNISSSGGVHTFNIPYAGTTKSGIIANTTQTIGGLKTFQNSISTPSTIFTEQPSGTISVPYSNQQALFVDSTDHQIKLKHFNGEIQTIEGVNAINELSGSAQTLVTGSTGTDFNISSAGTTHTFNIPNASATARGLLNTGSQTIAGVKEFQDGTITPFSTLIHQDIDDIPTPASGKYNVFIYHIDGKLKIKNSAGDVYDVGSGGGGGGDGILALNSLTSDHQFFDTSTSGENLSIYSSGSVHTFNVPLATLGKVGMVSTDSQIFSGAKSVIVEDAVASNVVNVLSVGHNTTGSAANGIGARITFNSETTAMADMPISYLDSYLTNATEATKTSSFKIQTLENGAFARALEAKKEGVELRSAIFDGVTAATVATPATGYSLFFDTEENTMRVKKNDGEVISIGGGGGGSAAETTFDDTTAELGTDNVQGAIDTIMAAYINKMIPAIPPQLSTKTISSGGTVYTARIATTGIAVGNIFLDTTPQTAYVTRFYDPGSGTLRCMTDGGADGSHVLTTGVDDGTYTSLQLVNNVDYYAGVDGKEGFWDCIDARCVRSVPFSASAVPHTFRIEYDNGSTSGTNTLTFYYATTGAPSVSDLSISAIGANTTRVSGLYTYTSGNTISISFNANNCVGKFYNNSGIVGANSNWVQDTSWIAFSGALSEDSVYPAVVNTTMSNNVYSEILSITAYCRNAKGTSGNSIVNTYSGSGLRIDTVSTNIGETSIRNSAGTGQFPSEGTYGGAYNSDANITGTADLLFQNGYIRHPNGSPDASIRLPVGSPNYSTLSGMRYYCIKSAAQFTEANEFNINFIGGNLTTSVSTSNFECWLIIVNDGGTRQINWIDCNAEYAIGSDYNTIGPADGEFPAVNTDPGKTTTSTRNIVLGSTYVSGWAYVRIGMSTNAVSFNRVTITV